MPRSKRYVSRVVFLKFFSTTLIAITVSAWFVLCLIIFGAFTQYFQIMTVLSGSMEPTIPRGSLIISTPIQTSDVVVGDIITFRLPTNSDVFETHRVNKISTSHSARVLETKGDANSRPDPWALRLISEPAWKVNIIIPLLGTVLGWIRSSTLSTIAILIIPVVLAIIWLHEIWRSTSKKVS